MVLTLKLFVYAEFTGLSVEMQEIYISFVAVPGWGKQRL